MSGNSYKISGCDVVFPHQAYGTQLSFMGKVITALDRGHNALLEAPTGSGKTLSLLCAALAWQQAQKQKIEQGTQAALRFAATNPTITHQEKERDTNAQLPSSSQKNEQLLPTSDTTIPDISNDDEHHSLPPEIAQGPSIIHSPTKIDEAGGFIPNHSPMHHYSQQNNAPTRSKPPIIYYATRTHSQIAQVVRELKRSQYRPKMAVLAAKQHYCINTHARKQPSLEDACEDLLREGKCQYFKGAQGMMHGESAFDVHDIEDLAVLGRRRKACPYYVSRKWAQDAELIFGPYSYFADPVIRRSMNIDVEGAIVIFDEAHNIEDVAREASSLELERTLLLEVYAAFERALAFNNKPHIYSPLRNVCVAVLKWMEEREKEAIAHRPGNSASLSTTTTSTRRYAPETVPPYERMWQGSPLLDQLQSIGLGSDTIEDLWELYQEAREEDEEMAQSRTQQQQQKQEEEKKRKNEKKTEGEGGTEKDSTKAPAMLKAVRVGAQALGTISRLIQVIRMMYRCSQDGGRDFRLVIQRIHHTQYNGGSGGSGSNGNTNTNSNSGRVLRTRRSSSGAYPLPPTTASLSPSELNDTTLVVADHALVLSLWCLNPAVAFKLVADPAHSIILTSGTLSPLDSFESELGIRFPIKLEAPHVVNTREQVWAGVVSMGPQGMPLQATYQHSGKPEFQDALGDAIVSMCRCIPDGVLLFLPSYSLLERLSYRWKSTGMWSKLSQLKHICVEPRGGGPEALQNTMSEYYSSIAEGKGGLFMAVCRGKISEGLDFADKNARGVIVVGIPFPNFKDSKVESKRKFNDFGSKTHGLLNGSTWYEQQACRALNQAIGRCIRHRNDWGAIMLVDDRFTQPKYQKGLSRWVRGALVTYPSFDSMIHSLQAFYTRLQNQHRPTAIDLKIDNNNPTTTIEETKPPLKDALNVLMSGVNKARAQKLKMKEREENMKKFAESQLGSKEVLSIMPAQQPSMSMPFPGSGGIHTNTNSIENDPGNAPNNNNNNNNNTLIDATYLPLLQSWVKKELISWTAYVLKNDSRHQHVAAQHIAALGIVDAFAQTKQCLENRLSFDWWASTLHVELPRGIQALVASVGDAPTLLPGIKLCEDAIGFGKRELSQSNSTVEERFNALYAVYAAYLPLSPATVLPRNVDAGASIAVVERADGIASGETSLDMNRKHAIINTVTGKRRYDDGTTIKTTVPLTTTDTNNNNNNNDTNNDGGETVYSEMNTTHRQAAVVRSNRAAVAAEKKQRLETTEITTMGHARDIALEMELGSISDDGSDFT